MLRESGSTDPRREAVIALARVEGRGAYAARLLSHAEPAERELVLGALRWQLTLDHLLAGHLRQPISALDVLVRAALRVGLYEARRMHTPVPVAVSEAVRVVKTVAPQAGGLVNAVLRRAVEEPWPDPADRNVPLSLRTSHPEWLVLRWVKLLGEKEAAAALAADQEPAPLCLFEATCDREQLSAAGCELRPHPHVPGVLVVAGGAEVAVEALQAGDGYAIDPAAVAVARLLPPTFDLCVDLAAAPGGKSLVLASERPAIRLLACDRNIGRTRMMRGNLARLERRPGLVVADAGAAPLRRGSCRAVILDAPCSGTGTLRRHPEIRWRLQPGHLAGLAGSQRRLAEAAAALLVPGGVLLYATCSLEPEENAAVLAGLGLEALRVATDLPVRVLPSGGVVIAPGIAGDGFTVHLMRRRA
ncbi:MAG TPA: transcription antitermination factor NusB [Thermoanaerobaculaceae bacterium]|nr:transcription antitermination factor NusB [Thermoanaerobaculaceae bacterium]